MGTFGVAMMRGWGLGEAAAILQALSALAGTDARRGLAVALEKRRTAAGDSGAVPVVRKAQRRRLTSTGMARTTPRIAANAGWAHRSSAKAHGFLQQHNERTQERPPTV